MDLTKAAGLVAQQEYTKAIEAYTAILEGGAPTAEQRGAAFFQRGVAEQEVGMTGHAIADFTQAIWLGHLDGKELATAHYRRGRGYSLLKQYSRAITDFDRAIQLEPAFAQAYNERGDAYRNRGIYKLAIQDYSTSIRLLNPDLHIPYFGRGLTHEAMGNQRLADADFRRASELDTEFDVARAKAAGGVKYQLAAVSPDEATGSIQKEAPEVAEVSEGASDGTTEVEAERLSNAPEASAVHATGDASSLAEESLSATPANEVADATASIQADATAVDDAVAEVHSEVLTPKTVEETKTALDQDESEIAKAHSNTIVGAQEETASTHIGSDRVVSENAKAATSEIAPPNPKDVATAATELEPTGAIAQEDRKVAASEIREQQTAAAISKPTQVKAKTEKPSGTSDETASAMAALPEAGGRFLVQVASYRDKDDALARFRKLSGLHSDLLSELSPDILRADLGAKGIYYRLRIGPFESFDKSTELCNALKARKLDCLVIERKTAG